MIGRVFAISVGIIFPALLTYFSVGHETLNTIVKIGTGTIASSMMSVNILLAARLPGFDKLFGGLDQVYWVHKWTGISLLFFVLLHENTDVNFRGSEVSEDISKLAIQAGELAFIPIVVLVAISFFKRVPKIPFNFEIPYQVWRFTHRFLGVLFIMVFVHQFFVKTPYDNNSLIAMYMNILGLAAIVAFVFSQIGFLFRTKSYVVSSIQQQKTATIIDLEPVRKGVKVRPGGFAFVSFKTRGLREPHPFTVSEIRSNGGIQFSIRGLGDFTKRLKKDLKIGDNASVEGGYGRFDWKQGGDKQLWLAAGIGVTPFLAWVDSLSDKECPAIQMIYCVRNKDEAVGLERLQCASNQFSKFSFHLYESDKHGRFDASKLKELAPFELKEVSAWFCGPSQMRNVILSDLKKMDDYPKSIHFERFEFR